MIGFCSAPPIGRIYTVDHLSLPYSEMAQFMATFLKHTRDSHLKKPALKIKDLAYLGGETVLIQHFTRSAFEGAFSRKSVARKLHPELFERKG